MVSAVIFDLDGVLVDSESFSGEASKRTLKEFGIDLTQEERERAFGRTDLESYKDYIKSRGLRLNPREINRRKVQIYSGLIKGRLKPIPGARKILETLKERGIPFIVASSGTPEKIRASLKETKLEGISGLIISGRDVTRGKPDPGIFLKAAKKLGKPPGECLVVEDSQAGVEAAKRAGMRCLALKSPNTHGQDLSKADRIINSLSELEEEI